MRVRLSELFIACHKYQETVPLSRFSYFYGKMGAGKSSIARLIDYCLGGDLELTPALQSEFVGATLTLKVGGNEITLERQRHADQIRAQWTKENELFDTAVPARVPAGEVLPNTGIEVLSDLFFYFVGMAPPKVRRSKLKDDSDLGRLSLRDLLWYCYLDQDTIDSEFFHLDATANPYKRNKSRDVLRFVVGFHQERVAELESELERLRVARAGLEAGAEALRQALIAANLSSQSEIESRLQQIEAQRAEVDQQLAAARSEVDPLRNHGADTLREQGRLLAAELAATEEATSAIQTVLADDHRHLNELLTLSTKFRRMTSARAVLKGVEFVVCPRCARALPQRSEEGCSVCGQPDPAGGVAEADFDTTDKDLQARCIELRDAIAQRETKLAAMRRQVESIRQKKATLDAELTTASRHYDSAYLSQALTLEHTRARLEAEADQLNRLRVLPQQVNEQYKRADDLAGEEAARRRELREASQAAEGDATNLRQLESLFLDCLVRSRIPGFVRDDNVEIRSPWFLPEVTNAGEEGVISTSFANLGSGGKKTLFKCCFALAMHRLATKIGAMLPTLLIIDSPMKNISERENREQFVGFHQLLHELAKDELKETQFIVIDKEYFAPQKEAGVDVAARHMTPDVTTDGPLLRGYHGH
jgi:hypothetical protein